MKEDPKLDITNRYKDLCRNAVNIARKVAETEEGSMFLAKKMVELNHDMERILEKKKKKNQIYLPIKLGWILLIMNIDDAEKITSESHSPLTLETIPAQ